MTNGFRRAMTCAYMPDGATFNGIKNILTDEQVFQTFLLAICSMITRRIH